jgi:hypothetical protein
MQKQKTTFHILEKGILAKFGLAVVGTCHCAGCREPLDFENIERRMIGSLNVTAFSAAFGIDNDALVLPRVMVYLCHACKFETRPRTSQIIDNLKHLTEHYSWLLTV